MIWINILVASRAPFHILQFFISLTWKTKWQNKKLRIMLCFTVCNRTYYGDVGRTYSLKVPPPQWNRLPFFCHITFTASGQDQGDIVQVSNKVGYTMLDLVFRFSLCKANGNCFADVCFNPVELYYKLTTV